MTSQSFSSRMMGWGCGLRAANFVEKVRIAVASQKRGRVVGEDLATQLDASAQGIYDSAALFLPTDSSFTAGAARDLDAIATWPKDRLARTALGAVFGLEVQSGADKVAAIDAVPLNKDQLRAVQSACQRADLPRRVAVWAPHAMRRIGLEDAVQGAAQLLHQIQPLAQTEVLRNGLIMTPARGDAAGESAAHGRASATAAHPSSSGPARERKFFGKAFGRGHFSHYPERQVCPAQQTLAPSAAKVRNPPFLHRARLTPFPARPSSLGLIRVIRRFTHEGPLCRKKNNTDPKHHHPDVSPAQLTRLVRLCCGHVFFHLHEAVRHHGYGIDPGLDQYPGEIGVIRRRLTA
ncbi:hypothetical protein TG4357_03531 [Thalassovita gelatinovora]|uniref:Uncharacterized protein n=1 Tax=Thalassovita gelatinovora TaxID=53501 RepID=A0A0P1FK09_THAGE|nr:hypothetical protein TG4357_03531 [Thalassovita gelatinovora]SER19043.1 hypothetical protein SAMN04488043_12010 [Thalassovita gelatinovora]